MWKTAQEWKEESKAAWMERVERSPVVCTRWCSLIIHCMRWMSLSPHTAQLYSALCLSAPGSADERVYINAGACTCCVGWGGLWHRAVCDVGLRGYVLRPSCRHTRAQTYRRVPIYACAFAQMYVEGSEGFSLEWEIGLGLVATISQCWPMFEPYIWRKPALY